MKKKRREAPTLNDNKFPQKKDGDKAAWIVNAIFAAITVLIILWDHGIIKF